MRIRTASKSQLVDTHMDTAGRCIAFSPVTVAGSLCQHGRPTRMPQDTAEDLTSRLREQLLACSDVARRWCCTSALHPRHETGMPTAHMMRSHSPDYGEESNGTY